MQLPLALLQGDLEGPHHLKKISDGTWVTLPLPRKGILILLRRCGKTSLRTSVFSSEEGTAGNAMEGAEGRNTTLKKSMLIITTIGFCFTRKMTLKNGKANIFLQELRSTRCEILGVYLVGQFGEARQVLVAYLGEFYHQAKGPFRRTAELGSPLLKERES